MQDFGEPFFEESQARYEALGRALSHEALHGLAREVVDRLAARGRDGLEDLDHPEADTIEDLTTALLHDRPAIAAETMSRLQERGVTLEVLYARYLAPAAARMGEMWDEDRVSFLQVSLGVGRIFDLVRSLRERLPTPRITHSEPVLFTSVPGETHAVGVEMAAELFRQQGWDVTLLVGATHDEILDAVARVACLVLGISSGGRHTAAALARLIHAIRVDHPGIFIIVSGRIVTDDPDLVDLLHPDSAVATVEDALATMDQLSGLGR